MIVLLAAVIASPALYPECYPHDLAAAGATDVELEAIDAISRGGRSKRPHDVVRVSADELAVGWAHFTWRRDPFRLNAENAPNSAVQALLYSEASAYLQLSAWRRMTNSVRRRSISAGCRGRCLVVALAIANSSPVAALALGEAAGWDADKMLTLYVAQRPTEHRRRRARWLQ